LREVRKEGGGGVKPLRPLADTKYVGMRAWDVPSRGTVAEAGQIGRSGRAQRADGAHSKAGREEDGGGTGTSCFPMALGVSMSRAGGSGRPAKADDAYSKAGRAKDGEATGTSCFSRSMGSSMRAMLTPSHWLVKGSMVALQILVVACTVGVVAGRGGTGVGLAVDSAGGDGRASDERAEGDDEWKSGPFHQWTLDMVSLTSVTDVRLKMSMLSAKTIFWIPSILLNGLKPSCKHKRATCTRSLSAHLDRLAHYQRHTAGKLP
jgi:hypothetical protein